VWLVCLLCAGASRVEAQAVGAAAAPAAASAAMDEDDDAVIDVTNPDYRVINLPTTARLPRHKANFTLTHRFNGNFRTESFGHLAGDLFGLDNGATIGFEYRYAVMRRLQAGMYRVNFDKTFQFFAKYDAWTQRGRWPVSVSLLASVEGANNFRERRAPALGAAVSRSMGRMLALYAVPIWVHNSAALLGGPTRDTFAVGVGGRLRVRPTVYVVAEITPRLAGYEQGRPAFGFGIEKRAGGHMFQLNFDNGQGSTFGQIARGGSPRSLFLGFNLARKFF
jgi:hypothetical protein